MHGVLSMIEDRLLRTGLEMSSRRSFPA
jgi:hypothetical protein